MLVASLLYVFATLSAVSAHILFTYPEGRGTDLTDDQWKFPCGGYGYSENNTRTKWPIGGGAIAFQPGHNAGHSTAFMFINLFVGNNNSGPGNVHNISIKPVFQIIAPNNTNDAFNSSVCFEHIVLNLPNTTSVEVGTNGTIQIVELAKNGAALYQCADITFADPADVPDPGSVCVNDTGIEFNQVFVTKSLKSSASSTVLPSSILVSAAVLTILAIL